MIPRLFRALFAKAATTPSAWVCGRGHVNPASNTACYVAGCSE